MFGVCAWHVTSPSFLLTLGKKRIFHFCLCLHFSTGSKSKISPNFCNNLLSTKWVSLSGAIPSYPSGGSDVNSWVNCCFLCCFSHLDIFRTVEPNTLRTIITKQRNPNAFLHLWGFCFSMWICTRTYRNSWNWNCVPLPSRDDKVSLLENICVFNIMIWNSPFNPNLWGMWSRWYIGKIASPWKIG